MVAADYFPSAEAAQGAIAWLEASIVDASVLWRDQEWGGGARSWGALARSRRGPNQIRREKVGQPVNLNDESWKQR